MKTSIAMTILALTGLQASAQAITPIEGINNEISYRCFSNGTHAGCIMKSANRAENICSILYKASLEDGTTIEKEENTYLYFRDSKSIKLSSPNSWRNKIVELGVQISCKNLD